MQKSNFLKRLERIEDHIGAQTRPIQIVIRTFLTVHPGETEEQVRSLWQAKHPDNRGGCEYEFVYTHLSPEGMSRQQALDIQIEREVEKLKSKGVSEPEISECFEETSKGTQQDMHTGPPGNGVEAEKRVRTNVCTPNSSKPLQTQEKSKKVERHPLTFMQKKRGRAYDIDGDR